MKGVVLFYRVQIKSVISYVCDLRLCTGTGPYGEKCESAAVCVLHASGAAAARFAVQDLLRSLPMAITWSLLQRKYHFTCV